MHGESEFGEAHSSAEEQSQMESMQKRAFWIRPYYMPSAEERRRQGTSFRKTFSPWASSLQQSIKLVNFPRKSAPNWLRLEGRSHDGVDVDDFEAIIAWQTARKCWLHDLKKGTVNRGGRARPARIPKIFVVDLKPL